jgi:hypothetical protein
MRKSMMLTAIVVCAIGLFAVGCGSKQPSNGGETLPPRDTSSLESSLLGHWQDKAGNQLFFSPDTVTFVSAESGEKQSSGYTIVSKDENIKTMKLEFSDPGDIFYVADPSHDMYPSVFFRKPGMDGLIFGAFFFSQESKNRLHLTETEYPFVDTKQSI